MHPVQHFKDNFDQPQKDGSDITSLAVALPNRWQLHESDSGVRNVCFVWEDGRKAFFNYAYLASVELWMNDRINVLRLCFGSYVVTIKGYQLNRLFDLLMDHQPRLVAATHPRYRIEQKQDSIFVTDILVENE